MIVVFKYANFTCCYSKCCDGTTLFGHASLFCTKGGFGISVGNRSPHFDSWGDFVHAQGKFGVVEMYACIPTIEDLRGQPSVGHGETTALIPKVGMSEEAMMLWWSAQERRTGSMDCADLVFKALAEAGAASLSVLARQWTSLFIMTPDSTVSYAAKLARAVCNDAGLDQTTYLGLVNGLGLELSSELNQFKG